MLEQKKILDHVTGTRKANKKIVFTNGCFDLLHKGHRDLIKQSFSFGDILIVGLNSNESVKRLKGKNRPIQSEVDRKNALLDTCLLYTSPSPRDVSTSRMPSSA